MFRFTIFFAKSGVDIYRLYRYMYVRHRVLNCFFQCLKLPEVACAAIIGVNMKETLCFACHFRVVSLANFILYYQKHSLQILLNLITGISLTL